MKINEIIQMFVLVKELENKTFVVKTFQDLKNANKTNQNLLVLKNQLYFLKCFMNSQISNHETFFNKIKDLEKFLYCFNHIQLEIFENIFNIENIVDLDAMVKEYESLYDISEEEYFRVLFSKNDNNNYITLKQKIENINFVTIKIEISEEFENNEIIYIDNEFHINLKKY